MLEFIYVLVWVVNLFSHHDKIAPLKFARYSVARFDMSTIAVLNSCSKCVEAWARHCVHGCSVRTKSRETLSLSLSYRPPHNHPHPSPAPNVWGP
eukprot:1994712-Amphidinium_carterae.1